MFFFLTDAAFNQKISRVLGAGDIVGHHFIDEFLDRCYHGDNPIEVVCVESWSVIQTERVWRREAMISLVMHTLRQRQVVVISAFGVGHG